MDDETQENDALEADDADGGDLGDGGKTKGTGWVDPDPEP